MLKQIVKDFYDCFLDNLDNLYNICSKDCIINGQSLDQFIEERDQLFKDKVYTDFKEYEINTLLIKNLTYISIFVSNGKKNGEDYYNTGVKIFKFDDKMRIINVNYF